MSSYDSKAEHQKVAGRRLSRRDAALTRAAKERRVRDRLAEQEARAEADRKKREKEREKQRKAQEKAEPVQAQWDRVEAMRARYAPRDSVARDDVLAERRERRAHFKAQQAEVTGGHRTAEDNEKARKKAEKKAEKEAKKRQPPMPSALRDQIEADRAARRRAHFGDRPQTDPHPEPTRVPEAQTPATRAERRAAERS